MNQSQTDPTPDELFVSDNEQFAKEERMYFCRDAAIRFCAAGLKASTAWIAAEELWNAKPEHL